MVTPNLGVTIIGDMVTDMVTLSQFFKGCVYGLARVADYKI